jgi:phage-related protein
MLDNLKLGYGGTASEMFRLLEHAKEVDEAFRETASFTMDSKGHLTASFTEIAEAIHIVQNEMGIAGATFDEAKGTISGSVNMMKSAWTNLITGMADENADFSQLVTNFVESTGIVWDNLEPRIDTALNGIVMLIEKLGPKITEKVPALIETVLPMFFNAGLDIVSAIGDGIGKEIPFLSGAFGDLEYVVIAVTAAFVAYKTVVFCFKESL